MEQKKFYIAVGRRFRHGIFVASWTCYKANASLLLKYIRAGLHGVLSKLLPLVSHSIAFPRREIYPVQ